MTDELTYEKIAYDRFVRARQHSEETQLPGVEQGHADGPFDGLDGKARKLIRSAQHFYISTVTGTGWPYVQHRGGPQGFVHISADGKRLFWPEFHGNNQFVTTGNVDRGGEDGGRVCLFFVDYPLRRRLKVFGHARIVEAIDDPGLAEAATTSGGVRLRQPTERIMVVDLVATDANCSKHIQPRWTKAKVDETLGLYRKDIAELKERIQALESQLGDQEG